MPTPGIITFSAKLQRPEKGAWAFLVLPKKASSALPTRGQVSVQGRLNGAAFAATLDPDGQKSHWLKVSRKLRESAAAQVGDVVRVEMTPAAADAEPRVPQDLRKALAATPKALETWKDITPAARRDWIFWITTARQAETRVRRVDGACDMLAKGKRRVCCFDRSGYYSKGLSAPKAAAG